MESERKIQLVHIQPGRPRQIGYVESFNGKLREECQRTGWFQNVFEARRIITAWKRDYNHQGPHSSLSYLTPAESHYAQVMEKTQVTPAWKTI
jgi:putative transposase